MVVIQSIIPLHLVDQLYYMFRNTTKRTRKTKRIGKLGKIYMEIHIQNGIQNPTRNDPVQQAYTHTRKVAIIFSSRQNEIALLFASFYSWSKRICSPSLVRWMRVPTFPMFQSYSRGLRRANRLYWRLGTHLNTLRTVSNLVPSVWITVIAFFPILRP